jgi:S-formylglutathione hydrolase FrmB
VQLRHLLGQLSLTHGWLPLGVQAIAAITLATAVGWRTRRWRLLWVPALALLAVLVGAWARWYVGSLGVAGEPAPPALWCWVGLAGSAAAVVVVGWPTAQWWRRASSLAAVPLCLLCAALVVNGWVDYFPRVRAVWNQLTSAPLPGQTDRLTVTAMQLAGKRPVTGVIVPVTIDAAHSHFSHRTELVYLPPAWFTRTPPPALPVVMMIGAEFNTPTDWPRAGKAIRTADRFAADHGGNAPVLVFADAGGAFDVDTECVNGVRGNAADHLTKDVVPFLISNFGVSANRSNWGVAGFSAGGTCALDLTVMHPELFSTFLDIAGDLGPNAGNKEQTIARLFAGRADAWAAFDPTTVITRHGSYTDVAGRFVVTDAPRAPGTPTSAAAALCALGQAHGIDCTIVTLPGNHDWSFAAGAFDKALPWLAGHLGVSPVAPPPPRASAAPNGG